VRTEPVTDWHAGAVLAIYQAGVDDGDATFETTAPSWADFRAVRLRGHNHVATDTAGTAVDRPEHATQKSSDARRRLVSMCG
jgi:L-amino acid N-acyltransferase YncA